MSRDYYSPGYLHFTELAPSVSYHHYDMQQAGSSAAPTYEMRAGAGAGAGRGPGDEAGGQPGHHESRKRRATHFSSEEYEAMSGCDVPPASASVASASSTTSTSRRRKPSSFGTASTYDDDGEDSRSTRTLPDKKQNHSEIEKRRRDKMNTYISELSAMIPSCGSMPRKLDKLTVLRMAVKHMRSIRGAQSSGPLTACPRPAYVTERELNDLVLAMGRDAFLLVVGCDRGRLLYVSTSVTSMLHYDKSELLGQSLFDILHPKDVAKVKEQLSSSDLRPRERFIDSKTMLPVKATPGVGTRKLCTGARRSFFCRIKCKSPAKPVKEELDPQAAAGLRKKSADRKYCVVQCTGYLKSWAPAEMMESSCSGEGECGSGGEEEAYSLSCLVAVGRTAPDQQLAAPPRALPPHLTLPLSFFSRHATDGKYLFVDQRVTLALGYLPQEVLGTSLYEYVCARELGAVARAHKAALVRREPLRTPPYSARRKDGSTVLMQTHFKPCRNPWTKDVEGLVARNTILGEHPHGASTFHPHQQELVDFPPMLDLVDFTTILELVDYSALVRLLELSEQCSPESACGVEGDAEVQRLIDSQMEAHKIGSAIAEEALRRSPPMSALELPPELLHDAFFNTALLRDSMLQELPQEPEVRNNVALSSAAEGGESPAGGAGAGGEAPCSPASMTLDGNGEAAMAVIMSLLEADAGLGGPVNFSGLPWPLP